MSGTVTEATAGKIRRLPISTQLRNLLSRAAAADGLNVRVTSGGQLPAPGRPRTGSTRHDVGGSRLGAADLTLLASGRTLNFQNAADQRRMQAFVRRCVAAGAVGVGAGINYMGPSTIHVGGGTAAVWGSVDGRHAPPAWIVQAHREGRS